VTLTAGDWMAFDRFWAATHDRSKLTGGWAKKVNFLRGVSDPNLMAVTATLNDETGDITLTHPATTSVTFHPDRDTALFLDWIARIWSVDLPAPTGLYRAKDAHLTDVPQAWIAIASLSSNRALGQRMGHDLSPDRWRANLWVDGIARAKQPWPTPKPDAATPIPWARSMRWATKNSASMRLSSTAARFQPAMRWWPHDASFPHRRAGHTSA